MSSLPIRQIDVQNRFVRLSMHGPWGANNSSAYINCRIDFPENYPKEATPLLMIEGTAAISASTIERITNGAQKISSAYMTYQRPSLEALSRYLQGESTIDEIIAWTKDEPNVSVLESQTEEDASSSDDEDDLGTFANLQSDDTGLTGSGVLSLSNINANVPLPKACGAIWANDGRLVCFFPPREENSQSLFGSLGLNTLSVAPRGRRKIFEGFGKLHQTPFRKPRLRALDTVDTDESESESESDDSYSSSSGSSESSRILSLPSQYLSPSHALQSDSQGLSRTMHPMDDTLHSNGSKSQPLSGSLTAKNVVSIHNLESLLPARRALARHYVLSGANACKHNAEVTRDIGNDELAHVWDLLDMIMRDSVPVDAIPLNDKNGSNVLIAQRTLASLKRTDSAIDLSFDEQENKAAHVGRVSIKWGQHPFGGSYLIQEL